MIRYVYATDRHNRPIALRWSTRRGKWLPADRHRLDALKAEGLAEFIGYR